MFIRRRPLASVEIANRTICSIVSNAAIFTTSPERETRNSRCQGFNNLSARPVAVLFHAQAGVFHLLPFFRQPFCRDRDGGSEFRGEH